MAKKSAPEKSSSRVPGSREEDAWLSDEELAKCAPAETEKFQSPVPTRMVSNGEYMPIAQTEKQKRVEARIKELANSAAKRLGISRRKFLTTSGGMAGEIRPEVLIGRQRVEGLRLGDHRITTDERGHLLLRFAGGRGSYATYSVADVLAGRLSVEPLRGRVVLLGR